MTDNEKSVAEIVGGNISKLRHATGLTQAELAAEMMALGFGWHRQTVAEAEAGRRQVMVDELAALASYFDMPPQALLFAPGIFITYSSVRIGRTSLPAGAWLDLWQGWGWNEIPPPEANRRGIDRLVGGRSRPWSRTWRREGGPPGLAFGKAAQRALARRRVHPGPIFVADEGLETGIIRGPWRYETKLQLKPGEPYVARDEREAEELMKREEMGLARRVSRQEAYRIRRRRR